LSDTSNESMKICDETPEGIEESVVSLLVELGMEPEKAHTLVCKLKAFSPEYRGRILEYSGLPPEVQSTLLLLFEKRDAKQSEYTQYEDSSVDTEIHPDVETGTSSETQTTPETTANQNVLETETTLDESIENNETVKEQLEEEAEELVLEALNETIREEIASAPERTESKEILVPESVQAQKYTSLESDIESTEEIEETLHSIEQYFSDLPLEKQEEIMPRYIKLRTFLCKDKKEKDFSCVGCLIGNTIDCPLFKPEPK